MDLGIVEFLYYLPIRMVQNIRPLGLGIQFYFPVDTDGFALAVFVDFGEAAFLEGKEAFAVLADFQSTTAGS